MSQSWNIFLMRHSFDVINQEHYKLALIVVALNLWSTFIIQNVNQGWSAKAKHFRAEVKKRLIITIISFSQNPNVMAWVIHTRLNIDLVQQHLRPPWPQPRKYGYPYNQNIMWSSLHRRGSVSSVTRTLASLTRPPRTDVLLREQVRQAKRCLRRTYSLSEIPSITRNLVWLETVSIGGFTFSFFCFFIIFLHKSKVMGHLLLRPPPILLGKKIHFLPARNLFFLPLLYSWIFYMRTIQVLLTSRKNVIAHEKKKTTRRISRSSSGGRRRQS